MTDISRISVAPEPQTNAVLRSVLVQDFGRRFQLLQRLNPARLTEQQVLDRFGRAYNGYVTRSAIIGTNGVFRARRNSGKQLFEHASQLWYPPAEFVQQRGRFNGAGESRFYASSQSEAALYEMAPAPGEWLTLLIAGSRAREQKLELAHIGIERAVVDPVITGAMGQGLGSDADFVRQLRTLGIERRWRALDNYLASIGTAVYDPKSAPDRYKVTLAAARFLLRSSKFQGILYPSIAGGMKGFNLCLDASVADQTFFPFEAWLLEVAGRSDNELTVQILRRSTAIDASGAITWSELLDNSEQDLLDTAIMRAGIARTQAKKS